MKRRTESQARSVLRERLEARRPEIEETALTRVRAISDPAEVADPAYANGLRASVAAALGYALETVEAGEREPPPPVILLAQARLAARNGIPLDTVLRRYFAGYSLLGYFILKEASRDRLIDGTGLQRLLGAHTGLFDRLLNTIGEEHRRETDALSHATAERRNVERIKRLLAGEPVDTAGLAYNFEGWHLGLSLAGCPQAERALPGIASTLDCRPLLLPCEDQALWAWLGCRHRIECAEVMPRLESLGDASNAVIALGEPGEGLTGWRLTHRQAVAASRVALREPGRPVRYRDVALLASVLQDDLLVDSIHRLYIAPLEMERDHGAALLGTLVAYLSHERNTTSAAIALGVTRQTVNNRLRLIETKVGRPLNACAGELDIALRLLQGQNVFPSENGSRSD